MALTLVAAACGGGAGSSSEPDLRGSTDATASPDLAPSGTGDAPAAQLIDLDGVDDLRARFGAGDGDPRLLLLLSPT